MHSFQASSHKDGNVCNERKARLASLPIASAHLDHQPLELDNFQISLGQLLVSHNS